MADKPGSALNSTIADDEAATSKTAAGAIIYCGQCGEPADAPGHDRCAARSELEPPRYCAHCRRRMVVQVVPRGWTARCSVHGTVGDAH